MEAGDARLALIRSSLDGFEDFPRHEFQKRAHEIFIRSLLPVIYGRECFDQNRERIVGENGRLFRGSIVSTPRCFGKTTAVSMLCAAILAHVPEASISVFNSGQRAARSAIQKTASFLALLKGDATGDDMIRMCSYSAADAGDASGDILIMEEASRIDDAVIRDVILPLAEKRVLLGIGTPLNEPTLFSTMLDDTKTYEVLRVTLDSMK